jgi:basic membrane protein A
MVMFLVGVGVLMGLAAGCAPQATPTSKPAATAVKMHKVGMLVRLLGDRSAWDSMARGIEWANERLPNIEGKVFEHQDTGEMELTGRALADEGYELVISYGYDVVDWMSNLAEQYPNTHFFVLGGMPPERANLSGGDFKEHEGCFTVGIAAGMLTKTGKVGFVGGMDIPIINRFRLGYEQGVHYVDPTIEVVTGWVGEFIDPTKGKELALLQFQEGVDIVFHAAGKSGEGVLAAAAEEGRFAIGVDSDQCWIYPGSVITSMIKNMDMVVFNKCQELSEGALESGIEYWGLAEGLVGSCYLYDYDEEFITRGPEDMVGEFEAEVIPAMEKAVEAIRAGEFCVSDIMEVFPCDKPPPEGVVGRQ